MRALRRAQAARRLDFGDDDLVRLLAPPVCCGSIANSVWMRLLAGVMRALPSEARVNEADHAGGAALQLADRPRLVFVGIGAGQAHQHAVARRERPGRAPLLLDDEDLRFGIVGTGDRPAAPRDRHRHPGR